MKSRLVRFLALTLVLALLAVGCSSKAPSAQQPSAGGQASSGQAPQPSETAQPAAAVELKMVMFLVDKYPGNVFTHMFIDKVHSLSGGRLKINLIGGPEAIPTADQVGAVQRGVVDIANAILSSANSLVPGVVQVGRAEYAPAELREKGLVAYLQEQFKPHGLYYLGASSPSDPAEQVAFYFKEPVKSLSDLKGRKIATSGGLMKSFIAALGATPVAIPFTEYFTAMERGVVDGYLVGVPGILDWGLVPVTKCMLDEPLGSGSAAFFVNLKTWEGLAQEYKDILTQAAIETEKEGVRKWKEVTDETRAQISKAGIQLVKFNKEDAVKFYKLYREKCLEESYAQGKKEIVDKIAELSLNPDFHRLK
ncbi:MAG: TRAP transporter substrate-binding protein DctP [Moorellales bacterium]